MTATSAKLCPLCGERTTDRAVCENDGQPLIADLSGAELAGRYTLVALAGIGAQGSTVWEAESPDGPVAVKLIDVKPGQPLEPVLDRIVGQLTVDCSACVRAIDSGIWHGHVYVVTPMLDLDALSDHLSTEPQPDKAMEYGRALLEALVPLHAAGRAHGNLHPANIFIDDTTDPISVLLLDAEQGATCFWSREPGDPLTLEPTRVFAPEQLAADELEPATDVYQVGTLMYRLATGRAVFETTDVEHLIRLKMTAEPEALASLDDTPHLRTLLQRALSPRLSQRHADAGAMLAALSAPPPVPAAVPNDAKPAFVLTDAPAPVFASAPVLTEPLPPMPPSTPPVAPPALTSAPPVPMSAPPAPLLLDEPEPERSRPGLILLILLLLGLGVGAWFLSDRIGGGSGVSDPQPSASAATTGQNPSTPDSPKSTTDRPKTVQPKTAPSSVAKAAPALRPDSTPVADPAPAAPPSTATKVPVVITSLPTNAVVMLNGEYAGKTPWRSQLADGQYAVVLSLPRHADQTLDLQVAGKPLTTEARLSRTPYRRRSRRSNARSRAAAKRKAALAAAPSSIAKVRLLGTGDAPSTGRVKLLSAPAPSGVKLLTAPTPSGVKLLGSPAAGSKGSPIKLLGQ